MQPLFLFSFLSFFFLQSHSHLLPITTNQTLKTYIIHLTNHSPSNHRLDLKTWHSSYLPNTTLASGEPRLLHSYRHSITGFSAILTPDEARSIESRSNFLITAIPDRPLLLHTTYTPRFLALDDDWTSPRGGLWQKSLYGEGVIIGIIDTGISTNHPSFSDTGIPFPPIKWKTPCHSVSCNNKILTLKAFRGADRTVSVLDLDGHGTHVAGIAAGNFAGTAAGMAPKAHLAIYKACFAGECRDSDVLAAVDEAINDRVDVLLIPFGGTPLPLYQDSVAIASFAAVAKGILVVASAGNNGNKKSQISHEAPWIVTVGASSFDRRTTAIVRLQNGVELVGESGFQPTIQEFPTSFHPLSFPGINGDPLAANCNNRSLSDLDLRSKIVLCFADNSSSNNKNKITAATNAGAIAVILMNRRNQGFTTRSDAHDLATSHLSYMDGRILRSYIYSTSSPPAAAIVFNGTVFGFRPSPAIAAFSSRGPSLMNGGLVKPDVVAPGVNVISASRRSSSFEFMSGSSMAAAHVAGIAALVRRRRPRWSPAMIHSAIVTSAADRDLDGNELFDELSFNKSGGLLVAGAGQIRAAGVMNPGLVYDIEKKDLLRYLCGLGYSSTQMHVIAKQMVSCDKSMEAEELNYPSISVRFGSSPEKTVVRTAKSVRKKSTVYWARIEEPEGVRMDLSRYELSFSRLNQEESFEIKFSIQGRRPRSGHVSQGRLSWVSKTRVTILKISGFTDNVVTHLFSGLEAGFIAVCVGSPVDVVKSRMMGDPTYKSTVDCFVKTLKNDSF